MSATAAAAERVLAEGQGFPALVLRDSKIGAGPEAWREWVSGQSALALVEALGRLRAMGAPRGAVRQGVLVL